MFGFRAWHEEDLRNVTADMLDDMVTAAKAELAQREKKG
jgi:hypothetical protein